MFVAHITEPVFAVGEDVHEPGVREADERECSQRRGGQQPRHQGLRRC